MMTPRRYESVELTPHCWFPQDSVAKFDRTFYTIYTILQTFNTFCYHIEWTTVVQELCFGTNKSHPVLKDIYVLIQ